MLFFNQKKAGAIMFDKTKKEMVDSERYGAIMIILANINDKLTKIIDIVGETQSKPHQNQTKQSFSTKPLLSKEDYD